MSAIPSLPADLIDSPQNGESRPSQEEISVDHLNGESNGHPVSTSPSSPSQKRKRATSSTSNQHFTILEQPIENPRPIRVIVIGAGISGIYAGIRIPERIPKVSLTIYEKNAVSSVFQSSSRDISDMLRPSMKLRHGDAHLNSVASRL